MTQVIADSLIAACMFVLVAIGFTAIHSTARFFHIALGAVYSTGAYVAYATRELCGLPIGVALLAGAVAGSALGAAFEMGVYRWLRRRGGSSLSFLIASLGLMVCVQNTLSLLFGDQPLVLRPFPVAEGHLVLGARITTIQITIVLVSLFALLLAGFALRRTKLGRTVRAVANDRQLAGVRGIRVERVILVVTIAGSALAAVAGMLVGMDTQLTPGMGFHILLMAAAAAIIGGIGSVGGCIGGCLIVGFAQHLGVWKLPTQWQDAVVFVIVMLVLCIRPQGLFRTAH